MPKITPREAVTSITVKTNKTKDKFDRIGNWWKQDSKKERGEFLISTATFMKEQSSFS